MTNGFRTTEVISSLKLKRKGKIRKKKQTKPSSFKKKWKEKVIKRRNEMKDANSEGRIKYQVKV